MLYFSLPCPRGGKACRLIRFSSPGTRLKAPRKTLGSGLGTNSISNLETRRRRRRDPEHRQPLPLAVSTCSHCQLALP